MNRFFTTVDIKPSQWKISHSTAIWTIGSCFADEIGNRMLAGGFNIKVNPLGTLFNPASICRQLQRVISGIPYTESDLFEHNGMWHSPDFHTSFSAVSPAKALEKINSAVASLHLQLSSLQLLMLTLGSARAFRSMHTGQIVANCHKLPPDCFSIVDLTEQEISAQLTETINAMRAIAPEMKTIITVSPVRHKAYGLHADKLSKARLLLAANNVENSAAAIYFPAYEIMTDELRDYRFYATDMVHPSEVASNHIYTRFADTYFTPATAAEAAAKQKQHLRTLHRPIAQDHNNSIN